MPLVPVCYDAESFNACFFYLSSPSSLLLVMFTLWSKCCYFVRAKRLQLNLQQHTYIPLPKQMSSYLQNHFNGADQMCLHACIFSQMLLAFTDII